MAEKRRRSSLGPHDLFLLDQWGRQLNEAFGGRAYLVGSASRGVGPWRDVDVRMLKPAAWRLSPLARRTLNLALSLWGRQATGLPVDFQFQTPSEFKRHDGQPRNPLGPRSSTLWRGIGFG